MFDQTMFNILVGISGFLGGFVLKAMWEELGKLRKTDEAMAARLTEIHVLVAGSYVPRKEFDMHMRQMYELLRGIDDKLDRKADK